MSLPVYVEVGAKRVFASALDWPGWSRSGRDEDGAIEELIAHGHRYAAALGPTAASLGLPATPSDIEIIERLQGGSGTDFGVPSRSLAGDDGRIDPAEAERVEAILRASWSAFDAAAQAAVGIELTKGPRGGGRDLDKIVVHVWEADVAYHQSLGHPYRPPKGVYRPPKGVDPRDDMDEMRESAIAAWRSRVKGEPLPPSRRTSEPWTPRYYVRRAAWHALDHAWEIEDRAGPR